MAAVSVLQNEADAEEVAQEAFLKAFVHLHSFHGDAKFSTWLIQIAVNEARRKRRKDHKFLYDSARSCGDQLSYPRFRATRFVDAAGLGRARAASARSNRSRTRGAAKSSSARNFCASRP